MSDRQPGAIAQVFIDGRKYLANPRHWCQCQYRGGVLGRRYCAVGYLQHKMSFPAYPVAESILDEAAVELYGHRYCAVAVNDRQGHDACLRMYDRAIQIALNRGV